MRNLLQNQVIKRFVYIILFALVVMVFMDLNDRVTHLVGKNMERDALREEVYSLKLTSYGLETQIAYATSAISVEEWARVQGNLMRSGDIPVILIPAEGGMPTQIVEPTPLPTQIENVDIWQELILGD